MRKVVCFFTAVIICLLALLPVPNISYVQKATGLDLEGTPPSETGDTIIGNESRWSNGTIVLNGNLTINSTGSLTLYNLTLIMNCTYNGSCNIEV